MSIDGSVVVQRSRKVREGERLEVLGRQRSKTRRCSLCTALHKGRHRRRGQRSTSPSSTKTSTLIVVDKPAGPGRPPRSRATRRDARRRAARAVPRPGDVGARPDGGPSGSGDPDRPGHRPPARQGNLGPDGRRPGPKPPPRRLSEQLRTRQAGRRVPGARCGGCRPRLGRRGRARRAVCQGGHPHGGHTEGPTGSDRIPRARAHGGSARVHPHRGEARDRADPSGPGPHGGHRTSGGRATTATARDRRTMAIISGADPQLEQGRLFLHAHASLSITRTGWIACTWTPPLPVGPLSGGP